MTNKCKISIVIPAYNRATIIPATLDSILAQTFQDWECVIVDDLSKDDTKAVVQQYMEKDPRFVLLSNERKKGAQGARNTGILHAKADWVICFDSDNTMHPDMLEKLIAKISDDVDVVQCFSNVVNIDTKESVGEFKWVSEGQVHEKLLSGVTYVDFNQAIIRKSKLYEIDLLDEDCPAMQEWETHIRLSACSHYTTLKEALLDYSSGGADAISSNPIKEVKGRMFILNKHIQEWNAYPEYKNGFVTVIYTYIRKVKDTQFRINTYKELYKLEPDLMAIVLRYWHNRISKIIERRLNRQ